MSFQGHIAGKEEGQRFKPGADRVFIHTTELGIFFNTILICLPTQEFLSSWSLLRFNLLHNLYTLFLHDICAMHKT